MSPNQVADLDEVEEEGISEDDYFEASTIDAAVLNRCLIKPGFVATVQLELKSHPKEDPARGVHILVAKHPAFGSEAYLAKLATADAAADSSAVNSEQRIRTAAKCDISRQIVAMSREKNGGKFFSELVSIQVKVLNPEDCDLVLESGDVIASVKLEKIPAGPEELSYTQIKANIYLHISYSPPPLYILRRLLSMLIALCFWQ